MALRTGNRIRETTTTSGTGTITLAGAVSGFAAFSTICSNGDTVYYCISDQNAGTNWEVGLGTWGTGGTLARTAGNVLAGSAGAGTLVSFGANTKDVICTLLSGLLPIGVPGGKMTIWVPAGAMTTQSGSVPSGPNAINFATSNVNLNVLDFAHGSAQYAWASIKMPKGWDQGTFTYRPVWTQTTAGTGNVVWGLAALATRDSDSLTQSLGTQVTMTVAGGTTNVLYEPAESSAVTAGGTVGSECVVHFQCGRVGTSGSDTLAQNARLIGFYISYLVTTVLDN
jgi:hypothetical protein